MQVFYDITGSIPLGKDFCPHLKIARAVGAVNVSVIINKDGEDEVSYPLKWQCLERGFDNYFASIPITTIGLYFYYFNIDGVSVGISDGTPCFFSSDKFQLTVFDQKYNTPNFLKGGIMYQIMVDRFFKGNVKTTPTFRALSVNRVERSDWGGIPEHRPVNGKTLNNDFFGGNLRGVIEKLDYLKSLNVTCIYLNPVFEAASNHKYDTADYMRIDPSYGENEDLKELTETARKKGISVILDGVFSHTGSDSVYFNKYGNFPSLGAFQSKDSRYYNWYSFEHYPDKYACWWGVDIHPNVKETEVSYDNFINGEGGVVEYWIRQGIAGWRLDVADELPDSFLANLTKRAKATKSDALVLGEVWEDASNKISYGARRKYFLGSELDSVTNYPFKNAIINYVTSGDSKALAETVRSITTNYPKHITDCLMNILGTHDTYRIITALSGVDFNSLSREQRAKFKLSNEQYNMSKARLKCAVVLQYTLPGFPCVYYGDEAGTEGAEDPFNRRCHPWEKGDQELTEFYVFLGKVRTKCTELVDGGYKCQKSEDGLFVFDRVKEGNTLTVIINASDKAVEYPLERVYQDLWTLKRTNKSVIVEKNDFKILRSVNKAKDTQI